MRCPRCGTERHDAEYGTDRDGAEVRQIYSTIEMMQIIARYIALIEMRQSCDTDVALIEMRQTWH